MTVAAILAVARDAGDAGGVAGRALATPGCLAVEIGAGETRGQFLARWSDDEALGRFLDAEPEKVEVVARFDTSGAELRPDSGWLAAGAMELLQRLLADPEDAHWLAVDRQGAVIEASGAIADLLGAAPQALAGRPVAELLTEPDARTVAAAIADEAGEPVELLLNLAGPTSLPETLTCRIQRVPGGALILGAPPRGREAKLRRQLLELNAELIVLTRDDARKARDLEAARAELERTVNELNTSYWHLKKIQEVLPICMECGRVKTGELRWETVVDYLKAHSLFLSHGYCPDCARELGISDHDAPEKSEV